MPAHPPTRVIDGDGNVAKHNGITPQCLGVVCPADTKQL